MPGRLLCCPQLLVPQHSPLCWRRLSLWGKSAALARSRLPGAMLQVCSSSDCCAHTAAAPVQLQLEKLTAAFQCVTEDLRRQFMVDGEPLLHENSIGSSPVLSSSFRRQIGFSAPERPPPAFSPGTESSPWPGAGAQTHSLCRLPFGP